MKDGTYDGDDVGDGWPFEKSNFGLGFFGFFPERIKITWHQLHHMYV